MGLMPPSFFCRAINLPPYIIIIIIIVVIIVIIIIITIVHSYWLPK